jgi:hypothetical protein
MSGEDGSDDRSYGLCYFKKFIEQWKNIYLKLDSFVL